MSSEVVFIEGTHKYYNSITAEEYISCTTLIKRYTPEFKAEEIAERISKRDNVKVDDILKKWDEESKRATDFGTKIHKCMERYVKHNPMLIDDEWKDTTKIGYDMLMEEAEGHNIESEKLLFNHEYKIAGQSDVIYTKDHRVYNVADFKTNKKIEYSSKYDEYMLYPLNHLQHCSYNEYALQLSLYAYMLQQPIGKMFLLHLNKETKVWTKIPMPYMKHEVMVLLKHYKLKNTI